MKKTGENSKRRHSEISDSELENVSGGYDHYDPGWFREYRFRFDDEEVDKILNKLGIDLVPGRVYYRSELNDLGIKGGSGGSVKTYLAENAGVYAASSEKKLEHN